MTTVHGSFTLERHYPAPPSRVFRAFADPSLKRRWYVEGEGWSVEHHALDFRAGGHETSRFRFHGGPPIENHTVVHDVVRDERIVTSYVMAVDGRRTSVSLATVELEPEDGGTRLRFTEQGAYFDDPAAARGREAGTGALLDALGSLLAETESEA
jgi:uncharacterized protein YndB with AHSA1/START domain